MIGKLILAAAAALALTGCAGHHAAVESPPPDFEHRIAGLMASEHVNGMAVALIDDGKVGYVHAFGARNEAGDPLGTDTVMYGASLTKTAFAYLVAQLAAEGAIDLDTPIDHYLPRPLPDYAGEEDAYAPWQDLAGDERWRKLTPRILLNHGSGFANFYWLEDNEKLQFHFDPGTRFAYSGDGIILLQFVLERGLGLDVQREMDKRIFAPFGMTRSSLIWRDDFRSDLADGWTIDGKAVPHDDRSRVRAAGSLDTTIADMARLAAGMMSGPASLRDELFRPQLPIRSERQFPTLLPDAPADRQTPGIAAGLGTVTFSGPQGRGFFKGGHDDSTGNMLVCLERGARCIVLLGNDVRAERIYPRIVALALGDTGMPWRWEYGREPELSE
ncbi:MAG: serine hydrolase [Candidatus Andeanibacterium colombiense]|uniref:Serine hydrolase n=1 Tax=Candidatus Andeanibacterium colombiense TaxID=3121345 RepID=A0AAJ6BNC6_9SPHN|nr:MAG: serine hydrolase [Sphingomonadaceae bacterium]